MCLQTITNDNFELGCTIIERSATDKAIRDINDRLGTAFQARLKVPPLSESSRQIVRQGFPLSNFKMTILVIKLCSSPT